MKKSEKDRLQEIYDELEDLKSELEDLVDDLDDDDDDEEDALETAIEGLDTAIDALDDLVDTGSVRITVTNSNAAEMLKALQKLVQKNADDGGEDDDDGSGMTNEQSDRLMILARLDQLMRVEEVATDEKTLEWIRERKKELRAKLDDINA